MSARARVIDLSLLTEHDELTAKQESAPRPLLLVAAPTILGVLAAGASTYDGAALLAAVMLLVAVAAAVPAGMFMHASMRRQARLRVITRALTPGLTRRRTISR